MYRADMDADFILQQLFWTTEGPWVAAKRFMYVKLSATMRVSTYMNKIWTRSRVIYVENLLRLKST